MNMSNQGPGLSIIANIDGWTIQGEIDAHSASLLAAAMAELPDVPEVIADVSGVTFMDSSGLRVFMDVAMRASDSDKSFVLAHPQPPIRRVVEISGLSDHLLLVD